MAVPNATRTNKEVLERWRSEVFFVYLFALFLIDLGGGLFWGRDALMVRGGYVVMWRWEGLGCMM